MLQKGQKNVVKIPMKQQNFKTLKFIRSAAKFTYIRLRSSLNSHKSFKTINFVEAV